MKKIQYKDITVQYNEKKIIIKNQFIQRNWDISDSGIVTCEIINKKTNKVWKNDEIDTCDFSLFMYTENTEIKLLNIKSEIVEKKEYTSDHVKIAVSFLFTNRDLFIDYVIWIYPNIGVIRTIVYAKAGDKYNSQNSQFTEWDIIDRIPLPENEYKVITTGFYNDTQHRNKKETEILYENNDKYLNGIKTYDKENIICLEDSNYHGIGMIKETHKCINQRGYDTGVFWLKPNGLYNTGWGLRPSDIISTEFRPTWGSIIFVYDNDNRESTIKKADRIRYPNKKSDLYIMSNTWGSGRGKKAANETNVINEIEIASEIGIDIVQIDDGWQNSNWEIDSDKFKNGWEKVKEKATANNITLGLWFKWDVETKKYIKNIEQGNFKKLKIDFGGYETYEAINHIRTKAETLVNQFDGLSINWDVTENYTRNGYYFLKEYGVLYVENRTILEGSWNSYIPYLVLRDTWQMSKYININKVQIPIQNISMVDKKNSNAHLYSQEYCIAISFMGLPIFFHELHFYNEEELERIKKLIKIYKEHREKIYNGFVFPIGDKPNEKSITGFQCVVNKKSGYFTIFREVNCTYGKKSIKIRNVEGKKIELTDLISKEKYIIEYKNNIIEFGIENKAEFKFYSYIVI